MLSRTRRYFKAVPAWSCRLACQRKNNGNTAVFFCFEANITTQFPGNIYKMYQAVHITAVGKGTIVTDAYLVLPGDAFRFNTNATAGCSVNGIAEEVANNISQ